MLQPSKDVAKLADRLCRPQRIGILGHRGVGKTTLLTMLYREAGGGRLPGLRLAAADAPTRAYLGDKVLQLETGHPMPGTLTETELRFHLYHRSGRVELLVKDYQGELIGLEPEGEGIRQFLHDCDAVWLCFDAAAVANPNGGLRRQQEAEQWIEDCLAAERQTVINRPVAMVLTKADLLAPATTGGQPKPAGSEEWGENLSMAWHAFQSHCSNKAAFAISSLGCPHAAGEIGLSSFAPVPGQAVELRPYHLAELLGWLATALQAQDEKRLESLWALAPRQTKVLKRCYQCFARRYPDAAATGEFGQRLRELVHRRRRRWSLAGAAAAACLVAGVWTYDVLGYQNAARYEAAHLDDPAAVLREWQAYRTWHPTRGLARPGQDTPEDARLRDLQQQARQGEFSRRLEVLRLEAETPQADAAVLCSRLAELIADFPEMDLAEPERLQANLKVRRDDQVGRRALAAYDEMALTEQSDGNLPSLLVRADRFLHDFPGSPHEAEVRRRRNACVLRLDERDIEPARALSASRPLDFAQRRDLYQRYLDRHPGGVFAREAEGAQQGITADWDRHDFRGIRDHFEKKPGDVNELVPRCRAYLAAHPRGKFAAAATDLLQWTERVTAPHDYHVTIHSGEFERDIARLVSRGPKLSVAMEVNGITYGPSTIVYNRYQPVWDYEFPRPVRWKLGDQVRIWVLDHTWKDRVVFGVASGDDDPVAIRWLAGEVWSGKNHLTFESDFAMPTLPKIE